MTENIQSISYLRRWISSLINISRIVMLIMAITGILVTPLMSISKLNSLVPLYQLIIAVLSIVFVFLFFKFNSLWKKARDIAFLMKVKIYNRYRPYTIPLTRKKIALSSRTLINRVFLSVDLTFRSDQLEVIQKISNKISNNNDSIFIIEGVSGSGKTVASIILIDKLLRGEKPKLFLESILFYDFASTHKAENAFLKAYEENSLRDSFVIIDNFHRIGSDSIRDFSNALSHVTEDPWKFLLIISQPREFIALCPGYNFEAFNRVKNKNNLFTLKSPSKLETKSIMEHYDYKEKHNAVSKYLDSLYIQDDDPIRWIVHINMLNVGKFNYKIVREIETLISNQINKYSIDPRVVSVVAMICALSIHRGTFTESELNQATHELVRQKTIPLFERIRLKLIFKKLCRMGFVLESVLQNKIYSFHQILAEHLKDKTYENTKFNESFSIICNTLIKNEKENGNVLLTWLYQVELLKVNDIRESFGMAMTTGAYMTMLKALERNAETIGMRGFEIEYEQGLLCERVGRFEKAREHLKLFIENDFIDKNLIAKAKISLIEAEHGSSATIELNSIINDNAIDSLIILEAKYWLIHMQAHQGIFHIDQLNEIRALLELKWRSSNYYDFHELLHFTRRVLFDCVRFHYLIGSCQKEYIYSLEHSELASNLELHHALYSAYKEKFFYAHYIHYDLLFMIALLEKIPDDIDEKIASIINSNNVIFNLIDKAIFHYNEAITQFSAFGDKTAEYIKARVLELNIARGDVDVNSIKIKLLQYSKFINDCGVNDLQPYPHVYEFKFNITKSYEVMCSGSYIDDFSLYFDQAKKELNIARNMFYNTNNHYGVVMCDMYNSFLYGIEKRDTEAIKTRLISVSYEARKNNYMRINKAIENIIHDENKVVSWVYFMNLVKFFPFVHQ